MQVLVAWVGTDEVSPTALHMSLQNIQCIPLDLIGGGIGEGLTGCEATNPIENGS